MSKRHFLEFEQPVSELETKIEELRYVQSESAVDISEEIDRLGKKAFATIAMPACDPFVQPILYSVPVQLLAYHAAVVKGTDVDQPRNLAKSVTVE